MKRLLTALIPILAIAQLVSAEQPVRERIEWADIWVTDADKDDLPRVLLIGDSITRGYFGEVEKHLAGKAYCARLTTSKCVSDPFFPDEVQLLLKQYRFAVIHFNNGLHGWGYTEEQYRDGLLRLMETFKKHAGEAKLIWATTTPVRERDRLVANQRTHRTGQSEKSDRRRNHAGTWHPDQRPVRPGGRPSRCLFKRWCPLQQQRPRRARQAGG